MSDPVERRVDMAVELRLLRAEMSEVKSAITAFTGFKDKMEAMENRMKGAIWIARIVGGLAITGGSAAIWLMGQIKDLIR